MAVQLDPTKWLIAVAGFLNDWLFSREWSRILLLSIPGILFVALATAVFVGGQIDRKKLANRYIALGTAELEPWQEQLAQAGTRPKAGPENDESAKAGENDQATGDDESQLNDNSIPPLSAYAEMLFRRAHLLEPNNETQFIIGYTLFQRGQLPSARQSLQKIAPAELRGFAPAHATLAKICLIEFAKSRQQKLFEEFQHHALIAVDWPYALPEVIVEEANLLWQQRKTSESIEYLQKAVKSHPQFYALLVERAKAVDQKILAQSMRKEGLEHFRAELAKDPKSELARIQLAQLNVLEPEGDAEAESLLLEGIKLQPSKVFSRTLSEIYRIRFTRTIEKSGGQNIDLSLLERALQIDPNNPEIAQTVAAMMNRGIQANEKLGAELNRILAQGQATMATHALLSEYHLQKGQYNEAKNHLEQVFRAAPMSVKYANNLAYLYARERRLAEAEKVAAQTLSLVQANKAMREPFVDELLDTLGMIFQAQDKTSDAISAYEASLKLNPRRIETRDRLAKIYRKSGNEGVAKAHEEVIKTIEQANLEAAEKKASTDRSGPEPATSSPGTPNSGS